MKEIKSLNYSQCRKMVSRIANLDNAKCAAAWLAKANITTAQYDELMNDVAYLTRELYRLPGHSFI